MRRGCLIGGQVSNLQEGAAFLEAYFASPQEGAAFLEADFV